MSADQLRRAADIADRRARATYTLDEASDAVAALLRVAADAPVPLSHHRWWLTTCRHHDYVCRHQHARLVVAAHANEPDGACLGCAVGDVAAAYLGEEPQV
jgi:hypothetical protein